MIAIVDYGMGNLRSVCNAFEAVGHPAVVTRDRRVIGDASHVVLPGVGAFGDCMANLVRYDLVDSITRTIQSGKPFLGICLGLQLLFTESDEFGTHQGLNIVPGRVRRLPVAEHVPQAVPPGGEVKIPHMGWNDIEIVRRAPLFQEVASGAHCYFVHSYVVEPADAGVVASYTTYGGRFASSIWKDNLMACQFHPEKSQAVGLRLIKNFGDWK